MRRVRVHVALKPSVFDPQGETIRRALTALGFDAITDVRQGRYFDLEIEAESDEAARGIAEEMAERVLANPVIEQFHVEST